VQGNMLSSGPDRLREAVYEVLGPPSPGAKWQVRCELSGQAPAGGSSGTRAAPPPVPPAPRAEKREAGGWPEPARLGGRAPTQVPEAEEPPDPDDEIVDEPTARQGSEEAAP